MLTFAPTSSYEIDLPDDAQMDMDERVTSVWRPGSGLAVQLSSAKRYEGAQVGASERLRDRIERGSGSWQAVAVPLPSAADADVAAAQTTDEDDYDWLHVYITWPDLFIYVKVSGATGEGPFTDTWAISAFQSLRRRL